ncbi:DUF3267 domain-containing protein [Halovivax asiaticus]|uniref:DUF3267 domain-containing protein n=1 Tax=Halovivax asiaticus TaxID=332953 RepID=UPI000A034CC9|nr:DUF3267 domain-containing protein [Halovivax asiaticus]
MTENWPPDGYTEPEQYIANDRRIMSIGLALFFPVLVLSSPSLGQGSSALGSHILEFGNSTGLIEYFPLYLLSVAFVYLVWLLGSMALTILVHEGIHYGISYIYGNNPEFEWSSTFGVRNPSVVAYSVGMGRFESLLSMIGPFATLSVLSGAIMLSTSGILAGTAAIMFCTNTVPSCSDIYNSCRIALMPRGAKFVNFKEKGELRSEFAIPIGEGTGEASTLKNQQ